jgi:hypothetical protein
MKEMKITIWKNENEIEKTYERDNYKLFFGTIEDILSVFDELILPLDEATVRKDCACWNESYDQWLHNLDAVRSHLTDARMAHWLLGLQTLTHASNEEMHRLFPAYY